MFAGVDYRPLIDQSIGKWLEGGSFIIISVSTNVFPVEKYPESGIFQCISITQILTFKSTSKTMKTLLAADTPRTLSTTNMFMWKKICIFCVSFNQGERHHRVH